MTEPRPDWMLPGDPPEWVMYKSREEALARDEHLTWVPGTVGELTPEQKKRYMPLGRPYTRQEAIDRGLMPNRREPLPEFEPPPEPRPVWWRARGILGGEEVTIVWREGRWSGP